MAERRRLSHPWEKAEGGGSVRWLLADAHAHRPGRPACGVTLTRMSQDRVPPACGLARLVAGRAQEYGQRTFLEDAQGGRTLSYARLAELVRERAAALDAAAIPPGARVLIDIENPVHFCAAYLGVLAAGRCAVPVNPHARWPSWSGRSAWSGRR